MQGSFWLDVFEFFLNLVAALFGASNAEQPVRFEQVATQEIGAVVSACAKGAFGLSRAEGALDVACLSADGTARVIATDGSGELRASNTGLMFEGLDQVPPQQPVTADVNGDGRLDLVALVDTAEGLANRTFEPCQLAVLLGDGQGGFAPGPATRIDHTCLGLGSGDFDEDGVQDFVVPYAVRDTPEAVGATLFLTRPGGQFEVTNYHDPAEPAAEEYRWRGVSDARVFDTDGDGHADVVFVATLEEGPWGQPGDGWLHVLRGDGRGALGPGPSRSVGIPGGAFSITAADFDEDGHTDVALAVNRDRYLQDQLEMPIVLFGRSDGELSEPVEVPPTEASAALLSTDYDGDGHIDLITAGIDGPVHLFAGRGDGSWAAPIDLSVGPTPYFITTLDFELDGRLDLVAVTARALKSFPLPPSARAPGAPRVFSVITEWFDWEGLRVLDLDGDADNDVAFGQGFGVVFYENEADARFQLRRVELFSPEESDSFGDFGDLNGDGKIDCIHDTRSGLRLHVQRAGGSWEALAPIASAFPDRWVEKNLLRDVNADGRLDVVEALYDYPMTRIAAHLQDAQGGFSALPPFSFEGTVQKIRDADDDGCVDLYAELESLVGIMAGDCAGGFTRGQFVTEPPDTSAFELADMNMDGRADFVFSNAIMLANSSGGYDQTATFISEDWPRIGVDDVNGDGLPDVISYAEDLVIQQGNGDGSVKEPQHVAGALAGLRWSVARAIGDVVGDSLSDALIMDVYGSGTSHVPRPYVERSGLLVELTVIENISARPAFWDALVQRR